MVNGRDDDYRTTPVKSMTDNVLSRRRIVVSAASSAGVGSSPEKQSSSPQPLHIPYNKNQGQNNNKLHTQRLPRQKKHHESSIQYQKLKWILTGTLAAALAITLLMLKYGIMNSENNNSYFRCSSLLRRSSSESRSNIILMASHLRQGSDGQLRLRIIEHNLHFLFSRKSDHGEKENDKPPKSILIFSLDRNDNGATVIHDMVDKWRNAMNPTISSNISKILFVPNNAILVDASKWMSALQELLPEIQSTNARVMLMNDSFLLTRPVPELWNVNDNNDNNGAAVVCGEEVCGLVWTAPPSDPTRHIQSYIRTLSSCAIERYMTFYEESMGKVRNVHELIELFEINLEWARRGRRLRWSAVGGSGDDGVAAIYGYAGAHPDADEAQKILIPNGYPAIKLKKFFVTNDPWLSQDDATRPRLPPSFSKSIYKQMNHDLNHLSDLDLEGHFASDGKHEERMYSKLPLVIKGWLRDELLRMREDEKRGDNGEEEEDVVGVESTISILEDYLDALNLAIASIE